MDANLNNFVFLSHNTTGWNSDKPEFLFSLANVINAKIIAVQEHMLLRDNLHKLGDKFTNFEAFSIPAVKSNENISRGRPSGGLSLLWRSELNSYISRISGVKSDRVQAVTLKLNNILT